MRDGFDAVGSGHYWQDVLNHNHVYMYDHGELNEDKKKGGVL